MSTRKRRVGAASALLVVAALSLSACDGGDTGGSGTSTTSGGGTGTDTPSGTATTTSVDDLVQSLLIDDQPLPAIASAQGSVLAVFNTNLPKVDVTAEILSVTTDAKTTVLRWRLKSTSGGTVDTGGNWAAAPKGINSSSTAEIAILDNPANQRLQPYLSETGTTATNCACSDVPGEVNGQGSELYASFPALGADTEKVDIAIPSFPVIKDVPVTRD